MDDINAFERQVVGQIRSFVGPQRPVDDLGIFTAITAAQSPKWRFQSMFSATKFVVAGAIVALFGGFLLAGLLTQPSDDMAPAAVTASPSPTTTEDLLSSMVTEEVEPGVFRVVSDGTSNDLAIHATVAGNGEARVIAGQDGSVWVRDRHDPRTLGDDRLFRLGVAGVVDASRLRGLWPDISVAPDGTIWALGEEAAREVLSLSDGEWTAHAVPEGATVTGIETPADGSVWASVGRGRAGVARLVDGEWVEESVDPAHSHDEGGGLAVGPDGTALLGATTFDSSADGAWVGIVERTEDGWVRSFTYDTEAAWSALIAMGDDGTAWAYQDLSVSGPAWPEPWGPRLLRRTDGDWEVLGDDESVPMLLGNQVWVSSLTVSPDGRLWIALDGPWPLDHHRDWGKSIAATLNGLCAGVLSYDGTSWSHHLAGACVSHVSAAPNGDVWATVVDIDPAWLNGETPRLREAAATTPAAGIYVITPEAVVATE